MNFSETQSSIICEHSGYAFAYDTSHGTFSLGKSDHARLAGAVSRVEFVDGGPRALDTSGALNRTWRTSVQDGAATLEVRNEFPQGRVIIQEFLFQSGTDDIRVRCSFANAQTGQPLPVISLKPLHLEHGAELHIGSSIEHWSVYNLGFQSWSPAGAAPVNSLQQRPLFKVPRVMSYNPARHPPRNRGRHLCDWCAAIKNTASGHSLVVGFLTMKDMLSHLYLRVDAKSFALERFNAHCDADRVPLNPGSTMHSEWLFLYFPDNAINGLEQYADAAGRAMNARVDPEIPVGWCSWYKYFTRITQKDVHSNLRHLEKLAQDIPITWFQLDDGYQKVVGDWTTRIKDKFPDDLGSLAGQIIKHNFRPGIWTAPFFARTNSRLYAEHPDWFLKDSRGRPAWAGWNPLWGGDLAALDMTHPQTQQWLYDMFHTIVHEWGFQFLKIDFLYSAVVKARRHDPTQTRAQAYRTGLDIIRKAAGEDTIILGCGAPLGPAVGVADVMRISADTGPKWRDTVVRKAVGGRTEPSVESALVNCITRSFLHRRFWNNDPDCILLRKGNLTRDEYRTFATVVGLTGGMVLISDNMGELDDEGRRVFGALVPPSGAPAVPADLFENEMPGLFTISFPGPAPRTLVAAINWKDTRNTLTVDFAALGLDPDASYHVFDYWGGKFLGTLNTDIAFTRVPAHGCRYLCIAPDTEQPAVVGTDLHITCGGVDISSCTYSDKAHTLTVALNLPGTRCGSVYVYAPESLAPVGGPQASGGEAAMEKVGLSVFRIRTAFTGGMSFSIRFE
jgi:alpha-galactosidase